MAVTRPLHYFIFFRQALRNLKEAANTTNIGIINQLHFMDTTCNETRVAMDPTQKTPSGLHVPVELLEQIVTSDGHRLSLHSICNLRLVCRSFADGLLPLLGGSKELDVYLDDEGMNELGKIATSPFAPYIRKLSISIRRVAHFPIAFQQTHRAFATSREDLIDAYKQRADDFTNQINDLDFSRASSWHELRDHAALAGFDSVPGPVGCKLVPNCEDFTPDDEVIREFAMLLRLFPVIETIRSCEEVKHGMIVVLDANGSRLTRRLVKLQRASLTQPRVSAHCVCDRNYDSDVSASFRSPRRVCRNVRSMSRHLVWDVPRIAKYVLPKAALFQTLKKIRLTFVNTTLGQQRTTADEMQGVAQFLLSCKNVASLELLARKNNAGNRTNSSITGVIEHLAAWK
jgi:hypothetical protein